MNADNLTRDGKTKIIHLRKNVQIIFKGNHLTCDHAVIDQVKKTFDCRGDVHLIGPRTEVFGKRIVMSYETTLGIIFDGSVRMGAVYFKGNVIRKVGSLSYIADRGYYTACSTCLPAWNFTGTKIEAQLGGYARIYNPVLHFAHFPVFWLPYIVVPLKSNRQTGFLFPEFRLGTLHGLSVIGKFYWVMAENQDSTWMIKNYEFRGQKGFVNYRYRLTDRSWGNMDASFLRDRKFPLDIREGPSGPTSEGQEEDLGRWMLKYNHYYELPHNYVQKAKIRLVSDLRYPRDFADEMPGDGDPALENRVSLTKNSDTFHASLDASYYRNLFKKDALADNQDAVHRFPAINYSLSPMKLFSLPLLFQFDTRYTNFARDTATFDKFKFDGDVDPNNDGEYDPNPVGVKGDLLRAGQRFEIQPKFSSPVIVGPYLDLLPSVIYKETFYQFAVGKEPSVNRRLVQLQLSARSRMSRVYGDPLNDTKDRYKHIIHSEISLRSIPWLDQPKHPFFGRGTTPFYSAEDPIGGAEDEQIQFDYEDRLFDKNLMTMIISNVLIRRNSLKEYRQIVTFKLSQSYDYEESIRPDDPELPHRPWSPIDALLDMRLGYFETNTAVRYYPYLNLYTHSARIRFMNEQNFIQLTHKQDYSVRDPRRFDQRTESLIVEPGWYTQYFKASGRFDFSQHPFKLNNFGYNLIVTPPGDCWSINLAYRKVINPEEEEFSLGFSFNYGWGSKSVSLPEFKN